MSEQDTSGTTGAEDAAAEQELAAIVANDAEQTETPAETPASPWDDPAVAKAEIERLRRENASARTNAKAKAADDARNELAQTIGKALGLVEDETVDPAALTEQLTKAQQEQRQSALELAIFRAAPDASAANALLDSRSFLAKVADLDPSDGEAVSAAVGEAVQNNPALGKRAPAPNPAQGSSGSGPASPGQLTRDDLSRMSPEQIEAARKDGRFDNLLGVHS